MLNWLFNEDIRKKWHFGKLYLKYKSIECSMENLTLAERPLVGWEGGGMGRMFIIVK